MATGDNWITCDNTQIDNVTLIKSLIDRDANGQHRIRVYVVTCDTDSPFACNRDDFWNVFRRAIAEASDGRPALRICSTDYRDGAGLQGLDCDNPLQLLFELAIQCFGLDTNGNVCVFLASIT